MLNFRNKPLAILCLILAGLIATAVVYVFFRERTTPEMISHIMLPITIVIVAGFSLWALSTGQDK